MQVVKNEIIEMLDVGVIEKSSSSHASPVAIVKKKDGLNRICVGYRKLNELTILDLEPKKTLDIFF